MFLQIIDIAGSSDADLSVEIKLHIDGETKSFQTSTSFIEKFSKLIPDLSWYFQSSLLDVPPKTSERNVISRLLNFGKELGDELIGEDFELMAFREFIEDKGYSELQVSVESSRPEFFKVPWEALILPDANYVLAAVAGGFHRRLISHSTNISRDIEFELSKDTPLIIHHYISRNNSNAENDTNETAFGSTFESLLVFDNAIEYQAATSLEIDTFSASKPIHIWHYDGPLVHREGEYFLVAADGAEKSLQEAAFSLAGRQCALFICTPCRWINIGEQSISEHLAQISKICISAGVANVLGMSQLTDPWSISRTLLPVYQNIARGLSLSQAIVEARKYLQKESQSQYLTLSAVDFQTWPVLEYYQSKSVSFFVEEQEVQDVMQTSAYANARQNLHGFLSEMLYPHVSLSVDAKLIPGIFTCQGNTSERLAIVGAAGMGKTQLVHNLAFYLVQRGADAAFYFDYQEHAYQVEDIQNMIKPILERQESEQKINARNLFVLDNFSGFEQEAQINALIEYVEALSAQGHTVVFACENADNIPNSRRIYLTGFSKTGQKALAATAFLNNGVDVKDDYKLAWQTIEQCQGSPFLISAIARLARQDAFTDLQQALSQHIPDHQQTSSVEAFYAWQWQALSPVWRRWLLLLKTLPGVVVEMLGIVTDANEMPAGVREFNALIGNEQGLKLLVGVGEMERVGFLTTFPYGRVINSKCSHFIESQAQSDTLFASNQEQLQDLLNKIVCQSLIAVIPKVLQQSHQPLIHNLLVNRKQWAQKMEQLWSKQEFDLLLQTLAAVSKLMQHAQLGEELAQWALDLLNRLSPENQWTDGHVSAEYQKAWIKMAGLAINAGKDAHVSPAIVAGVNFFDTWLKALDLITGAAEQAALFTGVVQFLQSYYSRNQQWQQASDVSNIAAKVYRNNKIWPLLVPALIQMFESAIKLEDLERAGAVEQELLQSIPFDKMQQGFEFQVQTQVLTIWMKHQHYDAAQKLLDMVKEHKQAPYEVQFLEVIQADIYFQTGNYPQAQTIYTKLLDKGLDQTTMEGVQKRLDEIQSMNAVKH